MDALGLDGEHRLDIVLMQLVKLMRGGEVVRMSKRTGKAISLSDLLDEIPVDAARYFFNSVPSRPSSSTSTSPCVRTARTPFTTSSMPMREYAPCFRRLPPTGTRCRI